MKNYKAEIIYKIRDATGWEVSEDTAEYISVQILDLFREIVKEAGDISNVDNGTFGEADTIDEKAGYIVGFNKAKREILSNVEEMIK